MHLWDTETDFLIRLFPDESEEIIDTHRLSETIALHTMARIAVSSPRCVYRETLVVGNIYRIWGIFLTDILNP